MGQSRELRPSIVHILEDRSDRSVERFIDFLETTSPCQVFEHRRVRPEEAGASLGPGTIAIVHEPSSWRLLLNLPKWRMQAPLILVEHHYSAGFEAAEVRFRWLWRWALRLTYACASRVVAVSRAQERWMREHYLIWGRRLRRIAPVVNLSLFLKEPKKKKGRLPVFGVYGEFCSKAGIDLLVRAIQRIPREALEISIGGEGPEEANLKRLANWDRRISWLGQIEDPAAFIAGCDVIVVPSRWEPFGVTCLEAKAAGRPVIVHAIDGLIEQAEDCGLAVPADPSVFAAALVAMSQLPVETWSENARISAREVAERSAQQWRALIDELTPLAYRKGTAALFGDKWRAGEPEPRCEPPRPARQPLRVDHPAG